MKVAAIGDVHANLPALEAVLGHAAAAGCEAIWNVGDWVGYNAFPNQVVDLLRAEEAVSIVGNYDLKVLKFPRRAKRWRRRKRPEKYRAFEWAYETLTPANREYLAAVPREVRLEVEGWRVLLTHGSPESINEHLYPDTPRERLAELAAVAGADLVVCGHSHQPFVRQIGTCRFVNTGSVGRPDDGDPRASYAELDLRPRLFGVAHHRVEYDVERAVEGIRRHGLPEAFGEMMRRGRKLDRVLDALEPPATA